MFIKRILVSNFLALARADVELGPGLNVIIAPNEGGKSSLMRAIITGLFRNATSKSAGVLAMRQWGSEALPRIELHIETGGEALRIVRDFGEHKQYLYRGDETDHFSTGRDVDRYLGDALVVPDEKLFERVCGIAQEELARVGDGKIDLGERLEEILGGGWGEVSPARVERELEDVRGDLRRGLDRPANRENWGPIKRYTDEAAALERDLGEALAVESRRAVLLRRLSEAKRERESIGLDTLTERKARDAEYAAIGRESAEAQKRLREVQKRRERIEKLIDEGGRITAMADAFPASLRRCSEERCEKIRREIEREDILIRDRDNAASRRARPSATGLILGAVLVIGGVAGWALYHIAFAVAAAAGIALIASVLARGRATGVPSERGDELERLGRRRREWAGHRSIEESRELLRGFESFRRKQHETDTRLREALLGYGGAGGGGRDAATGSIDVEGAAQTDGSPDAAAIVEALEDEFVRCSAEWHALEEKRKQLEPFRLEAEDLLRLEQEIALTEKRARDLDETVAAVEREMAGLPESEANVLRERLVSSREALDRAREKDALVDLLVGTLEEARGRVAGFLAERLPPVAGEYLSVITGGRYDTVLVDPVKLHIHTRAAVEDVSDRSAAGTVPAQVQPEDLSRGARDQVHFAVRLAIVELLGGRDPQPLLLDDPFVHFDAERRARALELVLTFARKHQVLLLSCEQAYERLAGTVVRFR